MSMNSVFLFSKAYQPQDFRILMRFWHNTN